MSTRRSKPTISCSKGKRSWAAFAFLLAAGIFASALMLAFFVQGKEYCPAKLAGAALGNNPNVKQRSIATTEAPVSIITAVTTSQAILPTTSTSTLTSTSTSKPTSTATSTLTSITDARRRMPVAAKSFDSDHFDLIIVIPSHWSEVDRRHAVRSSWHRYFSPKTQCALCRKYRITSLFLVGRSVLTQVVTQEHRDSFERESRLHGDLFVLPDFVEKEKYKERSTKTLHSVKFVVDTYNFTLLLKVDTDSFVFLDRLLTVLEKEKAFTPHQRLYMGNFESGKGAKPITKKDAKPHNAKWVDETFQPFTGLKAYPSHAKGPGYLMSYDLAKYLAHPPLPLKPFTCEDTAIGAYLMSINHRRVAVKVELDASGCATSTSKVVIDHYVKPHIMVRRWGRYEVLGNPCVKPNETKSHPDPSHPKCDSKDPMWTLDSSANRSTVIGFPSARLTNRSSDWQSSSYATFKFNLSWQTGQWSPCISGANRKWRCLKCMGSDNEQYDEWDCPWEVRMPARYESCKVARDSQSNAAKVARDNQLALTHAQAVDDSALRLNRLGKHQSPSRPVQSQSLPKPAGVSTKISQAMRSRSSEARAQAQVLNKNRAMSREKTS